MVIRRLSSSALMLISELKWPELPMMAPSFITSEVRRRMTWTLPVTVTNMSATRAASAIGMHPEAVHHRLDRPHRIDLGDDDMRARAFYPHRHALAAPAVAARPPRPAGPEILVARMMPSMVLWPVP